MDENEKKLVRALRENARTSLLALAKQLGMPPSTVHEKVQRYHGNIILKHTTLLDFAKLGYTRVCLAIKTTPNGRPRVQAFLAGHNGVNNLHKINSGYDYMAEIIGKDLKEIEDSITALREIPGVIEIQRYTIVEDLMRETFHGGTK